MRRKKFLVTALSAVAAIAAAAGIASAVWSASGSGAGGAAATVAQNLTVTAVTPTGSNASLYPGGPAGPVQFQVANQNPYAVTITGVSYGTPSSLNPAACASSNVSVATGAPTTLSLSIPANSSASTQTINGVVQLAHAAPDGCQGASFNVPLTVTGAEQ
jgi:hypothetical protein